MGLADVIALLLLTLSALGGAALTLPLVRRLDLRDRLAIGLLIGMTLSGLGAFVTASWLGMTWATPAILATLSALPLAALRHPLGRARLAREVAALRRGLRRTFRRRPTVGGIGWGIFYLALSVLLFVFFRGASFERDGHIETLNPANLGDLPYHFGIVEGFVRGDNYPPEHPEFAGARLTYPFLCDFVAAVYVRAGVSVSTAFALQNLALVAALVWLYLGFVRRATGSAAVARLALPLVLFSGGWGWTRFFQDLSQADEGVWHLLAHLPRDYTNDGENHLRWGNLLTVLLGTQRSIVLGMPLGVAVWTLWWRFLRAPARRERELLLAGILTGTLPLGHIHTFLVLMGIGGIYALASRRWRAWLGFYALALLVAVPQLVFMLSGSATQTGQFARWQPGWDSQAQSVFGWFSFWLRNTGVVFPMAVVAVLSTEPERPVVAGRYLRFWAPMTLCFFVPNLVQMAPWIWDNMKVLIYAHLAIAPILASLLVWMWNQRGRAVAGWRIASTALFLLLIGAGALDITRVLSGTMTQRIFSAAEVAFGDAVARATAPRSRIVQGPTFFHPVYLSGRRSFTGYGGHLWSHGLDYGPREADLKRIFAGEPDAEALLRKHRIDYIAVGVKDREIADFRVNDAFLARYPVVVDRGGYQLRRVR